MTLIALITSEQLVYYFARDLGVLSIRHDKIDLGFLSLS